MKFIKDSSEWLGGACALTTGNFDGVHLGHRFLLENLVRAAHDLKLPAVVVMFYPHPKQILYPDANPYLYLTDEPQQLALMEECGVDYVVQLSFTKKMAAWSAEDFIKRILIDQLEMKYFLMGYDHRLGNPKYDNDINALSQKYNFVLKRSTPYYYDDALISSTVVRQALGQGDVENASLWLGRFYGFDCTVVGGKRIGRTIGYPTANLVPVFAHPYLPKQGVYAVRLKVEGVWFTGMMQLGLRPTLDDGRGLTLEVHIFDFDNDIYGQKVELIFCKYLRDIKKFENIEDLINQLKNDENTARAYFS